MTIHMTPEHVGCIAKVTPLHGAPYFGTITGNRANHHVNGRGWHEYEFQVEADNGRMRTIDWVDGHRLQPATLNDVLTHFEQRERDLAERINKLRDMVGRKVPRFNPDKHLDGLAERMTDAFRHEDGSITYVYADPESGIDSPRTYGGNVSTLIQINTRCIDVDEDDADLREAVERWVWPGHPDPNGNLKRYLAMFRPDILHFDPHWSAGDSYGWGYVTRAKWEHAMGEDYSGDVTPEAAFDSEVTVYGLWATGEVYGSAHVAEKGGEVDFVGGHLGYDDARQIAAYHTDSPILEVLA